MDTAARIAQFENMAQADPDNEMAHYSLAGAYLQGSFALGVYMPPGEYLLVAMFRSSSRDLGEAFLRHLDFILLLQVCDPVLQGVPTLFTVAPKIVDFQPHFTKKICSNSAVPIEPPINLGLTKQDPLG